MGKYTYVAISQRRCTLMNDPCYDIWPLGIDTNGCAVIYPSSDDDEGGVELTDDQIGTFMNSHSFDRDLFETLARVLEITPDVALMMSLS